MAVNSTNFPYELTNITGTGNILEFVQNVNNLVDQYFMLGMLLAGFVILFVSMRSAGNDDALLASSFIISVLGIMFFALEFINVQMLTIIIIAFVIIFVLRVLKKD